MSLKEKLSELSIHPHESIVRAIDNKDFPLAKNKVFEKHSEVLAHSEYERCLSLFERKMGEEIPRKELSFGTQGYQQAMGLKFGVTDEILDTERPHRTKLEDIAERVIREMYDIPEEVDMEGSIRKPTKQEFNPIEEKNKSQQKSKVGVDIPEERRKEIEEEANKRIILNSISHGSSIHIWKSAYYIVKKEIEDIDPKLIDFYDRYASLTSILLWMFPIDLIKNSIESGTQIDQGYNKLSWDNEEEGEEDEEEFDDEMEAEYQKFLEEQGGDDEEDEEEEMPKGVAVGVNFPVLLHELNKCAFEILLSHSIPSDYTEEELSYYYDIADEYTQEVWHYYLGPTIWSSLNLVITNTDYSVGDVIYWLSNLNYNSIAEFISICIEDEEKAVGRLELLAEMFAEEE